jgi:hypothetical protein
MDVPVINQDDYENLILPSKPLKVKGSKIYVALTKEQRIIKHCYQRGIWSSSILKPYAFRFKNNSKRLQALGFTVPQVEAIYFYPPKNCYIVIYPSIPGNTIRKYLIDGDLSWLSDLSAFIAQLHQYKIYFRDLNTSNIIVQPNLHFALIDLTSISIKNRPLKPLRRAKNLTALFSNQEDRSYLIKFGLQKFVTYYLEAADLITTERKKFLASLKHLLANIDSSLEVA